MPTKFFFQKKPGKDIPHRNGRSFTVLNKPATLGLLAFTVFLVLFTALVYQRYLILLQMQKKEAFDIANRTKDKLQQSLAYSLSAAKTLSYFIDNNGTVKNFDSVASNILSASNDIDALQLVPGGVIRYVYPLQGNEKVIGYDILKDPARNKEAFKAIRQNEMYFAGPFELRQGGVGIVGRLPVYRNHEFWGFSAVIIKMPTLLKAAGIDTGENKEYYFQLSKINPDTKEEEFFIPHKKELTSSWSVSVPVPNGEWKLSVVSKNSLKNIGNIILLATLGLLLSVLGSLFIFSVARRPQKLDELVKKRTRQLKESEENYKALFDKSPLPLWICDNETFEFIEVNDAAVNLYGYSKEQFLKMSMIEVLREEDASRFFLVSKNTTDQLHDAGIWTHVKKSGEEMQQLVFSRSLYYKGRQGRLILLLDVTEKLKIENELIKNEEKYRSLIEQASDGIVMTDLDGNILEVNNSICTLSGYTISEMLGEHLYKFLPKEDIDLNPLRFKELMEGKSLLYERRLLKKDGSIIDVEVNSKMASSHTLIGFIRDVTERKKNEEILRYQARLLESVSDAVFSLDVNRKIVSWNKACEELYGISFQDAVGKRVPELVTFEYPDTTNEEVFKQVYTESRWKGEFNFIHPKTKLKTHLLSSINLLNTKEGDVTGFIITGRDISDRKKYEEEINKSNERFELIAQATNDVIWDHDFIKNETWGNKKLYDLYGFDKDNAVINLEMFVERIHPDDRNAVVERMRKALETSAFIVAEEFRFKTANDGYRNFYDRAYIQYDVEGKPVRIVGAMQDITERERSSQLIRESEEKFRTIIEQASDGIFVAGPDTYLIDVNSTGCKMLGYTLEELRKIKFTDLVPKEDLETIPIRITSLQKGQTDVKERRLLRKDGSCIDVEISAKVLLDGRYQSIVRDITERKKTEELLQLSEQKYRLLFYNNPLPMWMTTMPGLDIIDVNEAAIKHYGYTREEFLKLNARDMRPQEDVEYFIKEVEKMQPGISNTRSWRHKKKDGTIIHVEIYSHEIFYEGNRVWLGLSNDVTEKYKARELLQKSYEDIRQLASNLQSIREDERTNIAREIHDELGQQLTGLKMDMHWLSRRIKNTNEEINKKMKDSIDLINSTITTVRKIATDLRPSILDDLGLLPALEWQSEEFEQRSGTKVNFTNDAGDITVQPEAATALFRIYQELLTNIARHANASLVEVSLVRDEKSLYFSIKDNGIGFNQETISRKKTLGLLGIRERTLLIGGTYEVKSNPGKGSEIVISIPLSLVKAVV